MSAAVCLPGTSGDSFLAGVAASVLHDEPACLLYEKERGRKSKKRVKPAKAVSAPSVYTSMPASIMAIAAHPGDGMFTMGAAVAKQVHAGGSGVFLNMSLGEKGHPRIASKEYGEMQRKAMLDSAAALGATALFLPYGDGEVPANQDAAFAVCDIIREHKPEIVVTHWHGSWHKDHQNTYLVVRDAVFYAALPALARTHPAHSVHKIYFADNWEDEANFIADVYLDIAPVFDNWMKASALFPMWRGETGFRYNDYYRSLAVMRGCRSGFDRAVALMSDPDQRSSRVQSLG